MRIGTVLLLLYMPLCAQDIHDLVTTSPRSITIQAGRSLPGAIAVQIISTGGPFGNRGIPGVGLSVKGPARGATAACRGGIPLSDNFGIASCELIAGTTLGTSELTVVVGGSNVRAPITLNVVTPDPVTAPVLTLPANSATGTSTFPLLSWSAVTGAASYDVYLDTSPTPKFSFNTLNSSSSPVQSLQPNTTYYWSVVAKDAFTSAASPIWQFTTTGASSAGLRFVPIQPCRVIDTRAGQGTSGAFGPPALVAGSRTFPIPQGRCGIPAGTGAYAVNVTVVPKGPLSFLTMYPAGQPQPLVSTLNAFEGGIVANSAILPAGVDGAISVYAAAPTELIVDINGYFALLDPNDPSGLYFVGQPPCRIADTRSFSGSILNGGDSRDFPINSAACGGPVTPAAYSLNVTAVPQSPLGFLTLWPTGQAKPFVSTLNSPSGGVIANAAIVSAGTNGGVSAFVSNRSEVVIDVNGFFFKLDSKNPYPFAGTRFHPVTPCRISDTRNPNGPFGGPILAAGTTLNLYLLQSACNLPANATSFALNVTVVPAEPLAYLTIWPINTPKPFASTLNSDGRILANSAIVSSPDLNIFVTNRTHLIIDVNGYFSVE